MSTLWCVATESVKGSDRGKTLVAGREAMGKGSSSGVPAVGSTTNNSVDGDTLLDCADSFVRYIPQGSGYLPNQCFTIYTALFTHARCECNVCTVQAAVKFLPCKHTCRYPRDLSEHCK